MKSIKANTKQSIVFNSLYVLYWMCSALFFMLFYGGNADSSAETFTYTSVYLGIAFMSVDIHHRFITQPNIKAQKYKLFILYSLFLFIAAFWLEAFASFILHFYFLDLTEDYTLTQSRIFRNQIGGVNMIVFGGIALRFIYESFKLFRQNEEKEKQNIKSQLKLKEVELDHLREQINPHFLFNSLNCIYGLSLEKSEQTPDIILRLSSILDYILYQCKEDIFISEEVNQIQNYATIQQERFGNLLKLQFTSDIQNDIKIAPLLLFTLVENAFKHAKPNSNNRTVIEIRIQCTEILQMNITNSIDKSLKTTATNGGLGLSNLKKRLDLLYPNIHDLICDESATVYNTSLQINLASSNE